MKRVCIAILIAVFFTLSGYAEAGLTSFDVEGYAKVREDTGLYLTSSEIGPRLRVLEKGTVVALYQYTVGNDGKWFANVGYENLKGYINAELLDVLTESETTEHFGTFNKNNTALDTDNDPLNQNEVSTVNSTQVAKDNILTPTPTPKLGVLPFSFVQKGERKAKLVVPSGDGYADLPVAVVTASDGTAYYWVDVRALSPEEQQALPSGGLEVRDSAGSLLYEAPFADSGAGTVMNWPIAVYDAEKPEEPLLFVCAAEEAPTSPGTMDAWLIAVGFSREGMTPDWEKEPEEELTYAWAVTENSRGGTKSNVRSAPGTSAKVVTTLANGILVQVGDAESYKGQVWYPVTLPETGEQGYMRDYSLRFLSESEIEFTIKVPKITFMPSVTNNTVELGTPEPPQQMNEGSIYHYGVTTGQRLSVRSKPKKDSYSPGRLDKGCIIWVKEMLYDDSATAWCAVRTELGDGYVLAKYVQLLGEHEEQLYIATLDNPEQVPDSAPIPASTPRTNRLTTTHFTNKYGTSTTRCAHIGCSNYIASSGDTNCCELHSKRCSSCGKYIDEDAWICMDCVTKALQK